ATAPLASVELYSLDGALAASASCHGENETTITTAGAASGIYVLRAATADGSRSTFKLIKL
ncbi:MAG: T9SS type A sorting domain-containing protein, partial [Muribaculaceae bacterium]|nr:T9SS type A sorting domain-containing protein [Muribaculaceae bacterium]